MAQGGDARPPAIDNCNEWDAIHFAPCELPPAPQGTLSLANGNFVYDTGSGTFQGATPQGEFVRADQGDNAILLTTRVEILDSATLRVIGPKPLIIAAWSEIVMLGTLDVSSAQVPGAGANPIACGDIKISALNGAPGLQTGGGGGGGGGFGAVGGNGGRGGDSSGGGGIGGRATPASSLRGGCPGGKGGQGDSQGGTDGGGQGGNGGGAIQLSSPTLIRVSGIINASGGGGQGGFADVGTNDASEGSGAGGGGSGGMIVLDGPMQEVVASAVLVANGGGGGGGSERDDGEPGLPASAQTVASGAAGGEGDRPGGTGGFGGFGVSDNQTGKIGENGGTGGGGGGGGGGVGWILIHRSTELPSGTNISPNATRAPSTARHNK